MKFMFLNWCVMRSRCEDYANPLGSSSKKHNLLMPYMAYPTMLCGKISQELSSSLAFAYLTNSIGRIHRWGEEISSRATAPLLCRGLARHRGTMNWGLGLAGVKGTISRCDLSVGKDRPCGLLRAQERWIESSLSLYIHSVAPQKLGYRQAIIVTGHPFWRAGEFTGGS
jgi:hypothetical protein